MLPSVSRPRRAGELALATQDAIALRIVALRVEVLAARAVETRADPQRRRVLAPGAQHAVCRCIVALCRQVLARHAVKAMSQCSYKCGGAGVDELPPCTVRVEVFRATGSPSASTG